MTDFEQWQGFTGQIWKREINVADFINQNYTPYDGDAAFLAPPTQDTQKLWDMLQKLQKEERKKGGVLDMDENTVSTLTSHAPGYLNPKDKRMEKVVGLQTDKPLKRAFMPFGGINMAQKALSTNGYKPNEHFGKILREYSRTHNDAVFAVYTPEMVKARHNKIITGLPDSYGRGRIVGDYRRVALYGVNHLIERKQRDLYNCGSGEMHEDVIRQREEIARQIKALETMKLMA